MEIVSSFLNGDIWEYGQKTIAVLAICGIGVEFVPVIKFNPISALLSYIGKAINKSVLERVDALEKEMNQRIETMNKKVDSLSERHTKKTIDDLRWNILDFANSCRNNVKHSKEEFNHVISAHTRYEEICEKCNIENGQVAADYQYILEVYNNCMHENNFL